MMLDAKRLEAIGKENTDAAVANEVAAETKINEMFGAEKATKVHDANLAINEITKGWDVNDREALFGSKDKPAGINSPEFAPLRPFFLKYLSEVGALFNEDGGIKTAAIADAPTLDAQIKAFSEKLTEDLKRSDRKEYDRLVKERDALYKKRYPESG